MMSKTSNTAESELAVQLSRLRRSPKIGMIYELYRAEMEQVLRDSTLIKIYYESETGRANSMEHVERMPKTFEG